MPCRCPTFDYRIDCLTDRPASISSSLPTVACAVETFWLVKDAECSQQARCLLVADLFATPGPLQKPSTECSDGLNRV